MLDWTSCQDAELSRPIMLMQGMRAAIALDLHRPMYMVAFEGIRRRKGMAVGILQAEVLVEHRIVIVEASEVKTRLGREMAQVLLAVVDGLGCLGLQSAICTWHLLVKVCLHRDLGDGPREVG